MYGNSIYLVYVNNAKAEPLDNFSANAKTNVTNRTKNENERIFRPINIHMDKQMAWMNL